MQLTHKKAEAKPTLKASVRLIRCIFTGATDVPEFQRQLATPNVPKFSLALISLCEKYPDSELKVKHIKFYTVPYLILVLSLYRF